MFEADGTTHREKDVSGFVTMQVGNPDKEREGVIVIRFLNPLLASNAYAVEAPTGYTIGYKGGEKGDHVMTVVTLKRAPRLEDMLDDVAPTKRGTKTPVEPLLFGRSQVSPFLPPVKATPPHAPKVPTADPKDPDLVAKLSSLGFTAEESVSALQECDADLSTAYALLLDRRDTM